MWRGSTSLNGIRRAEGASPCWTSNLLGVANRTVGYALAGVVSAVVAQQLSQTAMIFGISIGVAIAGITALMGVIDPIVERWADGPPVRRLGVFGTLLIFSGFHFESVEHWLVLFDVSIR